MRLAAVLIVLLVGGCRGCKPDDSLTSTTPSPPLTQLTQRVAEPGHGAPEKHPELLPEEGSVALEAPAAAPNVMTTAHVRVSTTPKFEINDKYPWKLTLEPTPGVTLPKTKFGRGDHDVFDAHQLAVAIPLTPERAGDFAIRGRLDFAVCEHDKQCLTKTVPVALQVAAR